MQEPSAPFSFSNSYAEELPDFYVESAPMAVQEPSLLQFNAPLADELGLGVGELPSQDLAQIFSGQKLLAGSRPLAQAYAGHQFGGFSPQLGDGRGLLLGEVAAPDGRRRDIALKGSGRTAYSRGGDGKAAIGPVLREYLLGEAMHTLGIPTTRSLAAVATGESVYRENTLPGAILTRVASSHIRIGTFEFFASQQRWDQVKQLADYAIERHYPHLSSDDDRYLLFLQAVSERQAALVANWMLIGFIHGVMNTDNMAISGETIDYGPCAFMEAFSPDAVFSSIDQRGRYAYKNQPQMAQWNLTRFAEALLPLIDKDNPERAVPKVEAILNDFTFHYEKHWLAGAQAKLGLENSDLDVDSDKVLVNDWLNLLEIYAVDYTLAWRRLADAAEGNSESLEALFPSSEVLSPWLNRWHERIAKQSAADSASRMRSVNPIYIPRNHLVEDALDAATNDSNLEPFEKLLAVLSHPFDERPEFASYAQPAPENFTGRYKTFCGT
jgi:serine/tyrosine/threonine adenylyltransferase